MIEFSPRNNDAYKVLHNITSKLDGRKKFDEAELQQVLSFAFANSHKEFFTVTGHADIVDELINKQIFKRHSGRRNLTLAPGLIDVEAEWATVKADVDFKHLLMTKSKTFYCNREDCLTLSFEDIDTISFMPAHLLKLVDKEATLAAWKAGYKPSVSFLNCDYTGRDEEEEARWEAHIALAIRAGQWSITKIKDDGYAVANPFQAGKMINNSVTQFARDYAKNFALYTRDKHGRETTSYGGY